uniref:Uncharacterized protein n=1 Tax=Nelumbo nucifera TaxID=4432 RepID=A0A822Z1M9_NELNU|nr:TPA_asm: hypothetical protein HUJ06_012912 [Nelumbo nucifera]
MNPTCRSDLESGVFVTQSLKFSEHVVRTTKLVQGRKAAGKSTGSCDSIRQKVVRIIFTDVDATDSSDDEGGNETVRRVKRHVREIFFDNVHTNVRREVSVKKRRSPEPESDGTCSKRFRGVRRRPWGTLGREDTGSYTAETVVAGT